MATRLIHETEFFLVLVVIIVALALLVRTVFLFDSSNGIGIYESSIAYDAWSLHFFGVDRWGNSWPLQFSDFGNGRSPIPTYLITLLLFVVDDPILALRWITFLCGLIGIFLFWRLAIDNFSIKSVCVWCVIAICTSPWHIFSSQIGLDQLLGPTLILMGLYIYISGCKYDKYRQLYFLFGSLIINLAMYSCGMGLFVAPLCLTAFLVCFFWLDRITILQLVSNLFMGLVVSGPFVVMFINSILGGDNIHFGLLHIPSPFNIGAIEGEFIWSESYSPSILVDNFLSLAQFIFGAKGDGPEWQVVPFWGAQYIILTPFMLWGVIKSSNEGNIIDYCMLIWCCVAFLVALFFKATIANLCFFWLPSLWLTAKGLSALSACPSIEKIAQVGLSAMGCVFCLNFFFSWQHNISERFFSGFDLVLKELLNRYPNERKIVLSQHAPYITALVKGKVNPFDFYTEAKLPENLNEYQGPERFDRFVFGARHINDSDSFVGVVHKSEIALFSQMEFDIRTSGNFASVVKRPSLKNCSEPLDLQGFVGSQDFGSIGINRAINAGDLGIHFQGQIFAAGLSVHGRSRYSKSLPLRAGRLKFGAGMTDESGRSDGAQFVVLLNNNIVMDKFLFKHDISFAHIDFQGGETLTLMTRPRKSNRCDHAAWVDLIVDHCKFNQAF